MAFDPDAYLAEAGTATDTFDPDEYLGIKKKRETPAAVKDIFDQAEAQQSIEAAAAHDTRLSDTLQRFDQLAQRGVRRALNLPLTRPLTTEDATDLVADFFKPAAGPGEVIPKPSREGVRAALNVGYPVGDLNAIPLATDAAQAVAEMPADLVEFFSSPAGVASTAIPALPKLIQRMIAAGFTTQQVHSAIHAPDNVERIKNLLFAGLSAPGALELKRKGGEIDARRTRTAEAGDTGAAAEAGATAAAETLRSETAQAGAVPPGETETAKGAPESTRGPGPSETEPERQAAEQAAAEDQQGGAPETDRGGAGAGPGLPAGGLEEPAVSGREDTGGGGAQGADEIAPETPVEPPKQTALGIDPTTGKIAGAVRGDVPTAQIAVKPDLMQFKEADDPANGTNSRDRIEAKYNPNHAGVITLWEPINPQQYGLKPGQRYIVANGHHRHERAVKDAIKTQAAQIVQESAGYSAGDARSLGAEQNILDGKGTIYDAVRFIRNEATNHGADATLARARSIGIKDRKAPTIALAAGDDLYASFINEQVTPEQAAAIAEAAPNDGGLQRVGIDRAVKGDDPQAIANFIQAVKVRTGPKPTADQMDMFGNDDTAVKAAEQTAKRAGAIQKEISEQINSVLGASKRPERAAKMGVDVKDPEALKLKLAQLRGLAERAKNWSLDEQILKLATGAKSAADAVRELTEPAVQEEGIPRSGGWVQPEQGESYWVSADGRFEIEPFYIGRTRPQGWHLVDNQTKVRKKVFFRSPRKEVSWRMEDQTTTYA